MGKNVTLELPYRESGKQKVINIDIDFTSRGVIKDYEKMEKDQEKFAEKVNKLKDYNYIIDDLKEHKPEKYKIQLKEFYDKAEKLSDEILSFDIGTFSRTQMELIDTILVDNLNKNEMLKDSNFWERNVDVTDMLIFLKAAVYKDLDLKKKKVIQE